MKSNAFYIRALLGVIAFTALVIVFFGRQQSGGSDYWQPSSFNAGARGHKAFYTTLEELHWPVGRWQGSTRELSGTNEILILSRNNLGRRYPLRPLEVEQLLAWVAAGNHLILLGDFAEATDAQPLLQALGFRTTPAQTTSDRLFEQSSEMLATERRALTLRAENNSAVIMERAPSLPWPPANATPLLTANSLNYGIRLPRGNGSVTFIASPSLLDNLFLPQADNLNFVLQLLQPNGAPPAKIWFEEAHHGYRTTFALTDLFKQPGVRLASAQIALGLLVFLSSQLVRFGPVRPLERRKARSTLEFINSIAQLYRRANIRNDIVRSLFHETHKLVLKKFNLPPETSHAIIGQQLAQAFPELPAWRKLAQRFDSDDYVQGLPPTGWLKVSRELILIKNAMI